MQQILQSSPGEGGQSSDGSVEDWLRTLAGGRTLSRAVHDVLQAAIINPELASFASSKDFGEAAGVNVATVTRAAQAFGFSGWPEWRQEIRARYLGLLTAPQVAVVHDAKSSGQPTDDSLNRHVAHLTSMRRSLDRQIVRDFAKAIAGANRRLIVGSGSFAAVGRVLAHHAGLAGYRCEMLEDSVAVANAIADVGPNDVVIAVTFWRLYRSAIAAAGEARRRGATVCVLSDSAASPLAACADRVLAVPAESASFFPSLVPALSVVEAICAELLKINPDKSARAIAAAEVQWQDFDLLHFNSPPPV